MISREEKRIANQQIEKIRRNPPKVTREHWDQAGKFLNQHKENEIKKDKDIKGEIKDFSKELSGFVYNRIKGVGALFHGIGEGKKNLCSVCNQHESQMYNMNDGQWYCAEHRWIGNLNKEQKRKEQVCLSTKE